MSDSMWPHRWQPTRLHCLWDSPGKNTGVGCHFLLQCMKVKSESEVAESFTTFSDTMDCSPPGSSVRGISQARVLEWGAIKLATFIFKHPGLFYVHITFRFYLSIDYFCINAYISIILIWLTELWGSNIIVNLKKNFNSTWHFLSSQEIEHYIN